MRKTILIISELVAGGVERVNTLLAKGLKKYYNVHFLAIKGIGKELMKEIDYITLNSSSGKKAFFKIIKTMQIINPDIIITCTHTDTLCSLIYSTWFNKKTKTVFIVHSVYSSMFTYKKRRALLFQHYLPKILRLYNKCSAVVYVSKGVKEDFRKLYCVKKAKEYIVYNPVFEELPMRVENIPPLHFPIRLVSVGRLDVEKRQELLLEVVAVLNRKSCKAELYLYGQGPLKEKLHNQAVSLGIENNVYFKGFSTSILKEIRKYDVFVLSSEFESFGNVIVEAMGVGLPVIVMDCPVGPREILKNGTLGALIKNGDINQFAKAVKETVENYPIDVIKKAHKNAQNYTIDQVVNQYLNIFND